MRNTQKEGYDGPPHTILMPAFLSPLEAGNTVFPASLAERACAHDLILVNMTEDNSAERLLEKGFLPDKMRYKRTKCPSCFWVGSREDMMATGVAATLRS